MANEIALNRSITTIEAEISERVGTGLSNAGIAFKLEVNIGYEGDTVVAGQLGVAIPSLETEPFAAAIEIVPKAGVAHYQIKVPVQLKARKSFRIYERELKTVEVFFEVGIDGPLDTTAKIELMPPVEIDAGVSPAYSLVFQQNSIPLLSQLELKNTLAEPFEELKLIASFDPPLFESMTWNLDHLGPRATIRLREKDINLSAETLDKITEQAGMTVCFELTAKEEVIARSQHELTVLPKNQWGGEKHMPELLAAFITPNSHYVQVLLKKALGLLEKNGQPAKLDGYSSGEPENPYMIAAALWSAIFSEGINYSVPPASFGTAGQKIRLPQDISTTGLATCLDTALLFASCLEQAGLNGLIALTKGHAMVGLWLNDECFPLVTNDDPIDLRNRAALKDLVLFETTLVCNSSPVSFAQAIAEADRQIADEKSHQFIYVIDVKQARSRQIRPLSFGPEDTSRTADPTNKKDVELPLRPVLPKKQKAELNDEDLTPEGRLDRWQRMLLDLSKRNKLLNLKQRGLVLPLICHDLCTLEDHLASGQKFDVLSREELESHHRDAELHKQSTGASLHEGIVTEQLANGNIIADGSQKDLEKKLKELYRRAKSDIEEGGSNTLFLALGTLRWQPSPDSKLSYRAPLILLPVKLERRSARAKPKILQIPDEGPQFNLTLIEFLAQDFEIDLSQFQRELPTDDSGVDVRAIWNIVRSKIVGTAGFEVIEESAISNFSFAKYVMWRDLTDRIDELKASDFVKHMIDRPRSLYRDTFQFPEARSLDTAREPADILAPLNADSSQLLAIAASDNQKDYVLEGPPGTGKSETIANIIAHNIAKGKKVLFVAEKMAALDVVYKRLKKVGLGHLCLELHSNKASKKGLMSQLDAAKNHLAKQNRAKWQRDAKDLKDLRDNLNVYVHELHRISFLGYSARDAIAHSYRMTETFDLGWPSSLAECPCQTEEQLDQRRAHVKALGNAFEGLERIDLAAVEYIQEGEWSIAWQNQLEQSAGDLLGHLDALAQTFGAFASALGVPTPDASSFTLANYQPWAEIVAIISHSDRSLAAFALADNAPDQFEALHDLQQHKESLANETSQQRLRPDFEALCEAPLTELSAKIEGNYETGQEAYAAVLSVHSHLKSLGCAGDFDAKEDSLVHQHDMHEKCRELSADGIVGLPIASWLKERQDIAASFLPRPFKKSRLFKTIAAHKVAPFKDLGELERLADLQLVVLNRHKEHTLERLKWAVKLQKTAEQAQQKMRLFPKDKIVASWASTAEQIAEHKNAGVSLRNTLHAATLQFESGSNLAQTVAQVLKEKSYGSQNATLEAQGTDFNKAFDDAGASLTALAKLCRNPGIDEIALERIKAFCQKVSSPSTNVRDWCHWIEQKKIAEKMGLAAVVEKLQCGVIPWDKVQDYFESAFAGWLAPLLIDSSDTLRRFNRRQHEDLIHEFRKLDADLADTTGAYISAQIASSTGQKDNDDYQDEESTLQREVTKKTKHLSQRNLLKSLGRYATHLCPCFMMSPLSVAQFLPLDYPKFDLVVFDEASQITVWDAVGAIARGKNVIIVGDPKQMPPTSFFNRAQDTDDSEMPDLESILEQALAAGVTQHSLKGHYRSKHESLIAFSNDRYYQNSLVTYPSSDTKESAVTLRRVDGVFSSGKERHNPIEAKAVVQEITDRLKDPKRSHLSIGVVTFNSNQQTLIENLLDEARVKDPSLERFFNDSAKEPVFVKNLETVQGDQRDVIILSVGFGPKTPGANTMSMLFGPLNRTGGERRLNVAITRSSTEMMVFCSFDPHMIDLSRTKAEAVRDLKHYLDYAARGLVALAQQTTESGVDQFDSPLEQSVAERLRKLGWSVVTQVGVSKFRIDLGIKNPDLPGSYLAGVECDGATYHSSPTARDRDRVRHIVLESLGWTIIRIWSTDYFINPEDTIQIVHSKLEAALAAYRRAEEERLAAEEEAKKRAEERAKAPPEPGPSLAADAVAEPEVAAPEEAPRAMAAPAGAKEVFEHRIYEGGDLPDPKTLSSKDVCTYLEQIVATEGPVLADRVFEIYIRQCGFKRKGQELVATLNKAVQYGVKRGTLVETNEWQTRDHSKWIIRLPSQPEFILRTTGDRSFPEIPPSELRAAAQYVLDDSLVEGSDQHLKEILTHYGFTRLTAGIKKSLVKALEG